MTLPINNAQIAHTTTEWQSLNPVLTPDAIGIEIMSNGYNRYKRGDGTTAWLSLPYIDKQYPIADIINAVYPIGSIYMSVNSTSPATLFGGTWAQLKDRFLLGAGDTYTNGATGGESTHTLASTEMPNHDHDGVITIGGYKLTTVSHYDYGSGTPYVSVDGTTETGQSADIQSAGGGAAHNNMPPYLVVYMWKRTA